jgi:Fic family protein
MNDKFHMSLPENIFLAKKILVQNIYNSAKLEGVNTTFPETEAILGGVNVPTAKLSDIQVILNLRDAWNFMLNTIESDINLDFIEKLNGFISRNESLDWGHLRAGNIGISGTGYKPAIPVRKNVAENITKIVSDTTRSATEKALDLFLAIIYGQIFWDGNKRTATLAANAVLIKSGAGILSVSDKNIVKFNGLLTVLYDTGDTATLKNFLYETAVIDFSADFTVHRDVPLNVPENVPLNPTEKNVLSMISENPSLTADEIALAIGKTRKTAQRATAALKSRGIIARVGSSKSGYWLVSREKI